MIMNIQHKELTVISFDANNQQSATEVIYTILNKYPNQILCLQDPHLNIYGQPLHIENYTMFYPTTEQSCDTTVISNNLNCNPTKIYTCKDCIVRIRINILNTPPWIITNLYSAGGEPDTTWKIAQHLPKHPNSLLVEDFNMRHPLWYGPAPISS